MKRITPARFFLICLATLSTCAFADLVTLKTDEKIEGKIIAESETEITISTKVSATITDERVIKRTEIKSITKDAPDELRWQGLKNVKLGRNSFPLTSYDLAINPFNGFMAEFPTSKFAAEAKKLADEFAAEKKRVEAGEVKLDEKWLSKEEALKEGVQIKALTAFNYMKDQSTRDMTGALNTLDAIEKNFPGTRAYPDAVEYAQKMLPALKAEVDRRSKALAAQKIEQTDAIKKLTGPDKTKLENERKGVQTALDANVSAAEKLGLKWLPLSPANERSLKILETKISSETQRLANIPIAKMRASIQTALKARTLLEAKDLDGATAALTQASADWSNNEIATRLRTELEAARKIAAATPAAEIAPAAPEVAAVETKPAKTETSDTSAEPVAEQVDSDKPFLLTPGGAVTVVILVGLVVAAFSAIKKIKARANDDGQE